MKTLTCKECLERGSGIDKYYIKLFELCESCSEDESDSDYDEIERRDMLAEGLQSMEEGITQEYANSNW